MHLVEWNDRSIEDRRRIICVAASKLEAASDADFRVVHYLMDNFEIINLFVRELLKVQDCGKHQYSAQRIYEFLAHQNTLLQRKLNFIENARTATVIARLLTEVFRTDLIGFFDNEGVKA